MFTYQQIFLDIAETLTSENWRKGGYFKEDQGQLCMCAHGALQIRVNPEVKKALTVTDMRTAAWGAVATTIVEETEIKNRPSVSPQEIWNLRPSWTKEEYIYKDKNYGKREAHYLLGMVGLTAKFNDAPETTFEMVKEKFREASQLAGELGV